jgi:hypothetical protein
MAAAGKASAARERRRRNRELRARLGLTGTDTRRPVRIPAASRTPIASSTCPWWSYAGHPRRHGVPGRPAVAEERDDAPSAAGPARAQAGLGDDARGAAGVRSGAGQDHREELAELNRPKRERKLRAGLATPRNQKEWAIFQAGLADWRKDEPGPGQPEDR